MGPRGRPTGQEEEEAVHAEAQNLPLRLPSGTTSPFLQVKDPMEVTPGGLSSHLHGRQNAGSPLGPAIQKMSGEKSRPRTGFSTPVL